MISDDCGLPAAHPGVYPIRSAGASRALSVRNFAACWPAVNRGRKPRKTFYGKKKTFFGAALRKLVFIVLAFTACLLFPEGGDGACIRQQAPSAAFSAGDMHADEWQCERTYNSDLNHQPRVLREAESCPVQPSFRYGDRQVPAERAVVRGAASWGCGTGVAKLTAAFRTSDLSAGPHAVDYYVYRLRRLII